MTNISGFPTATGIYSRLPAQAVPAAQQPATVPGTSTAFPGTHGNGVRQKRDAPPPDTLETRAAADAQVASAFGSTLHDLFFGTSVTPPDVPVPPNSTLGRWRGLLDDALGSPAFTAWAKQQGVDTTSMKFSPSRAEMTAVVGNAWKTFSLTDDSGWAEVSRAVLAAARRIAPGPGEILSGVLPKGDLPWGVVGAFYLRPFELSPEQVSSFHKRYVEKGHFDFPTDPYGALRSPEEFAKHEERLGDSINTHALITALESQVDDADGKIDLSKVKIPLDPRSAIAKRLKSRRRPSSEISADRLVGQLEMNVPGNAAGALNVAHMLSFDLVHRAPHASGGGALPLTRLSESTTLGINTKKKLIEIVERWKTLNPDLAPQGQDGPAAQSLFGRLINCLPDDIRKVISTDPETAMNELIRTPEARALGKKIQVELGGVETATSSNEFVSAALALEFDSMGGAGRHNLSGYSLYGQQNIGATADQIIGRFTRHLEGRVGAEMAPITARLLLSISAPELLTKDMPPNLVYGSHTWANYTIEALRIEKRVPGAVANMTFSQVMVFGQTVPVSDKGQADLEEVRRAPVLDWAVANGVIRAKENSVYSADDYNVAANAMVKQQGELGLASEALNAEPVSRKELALQELKRIYGSDIDFEKKVIKDSHEVWPDITYYSVLEIYMSGHLGQKAWESRDEKTYPFHPVMTRKFYLLADINKKFDDLFEKYKARREIAINVMFRYHVSLLPVADRNILDGSDISFYSVRKPYDKKVVGKAGNHETQKYVSSKPSLEETLQLTGRQGVLIKADRGNGDIHYYSYLPGQSKIIKEPGLKAPLVNRPQTEWKRPDSSGKPNNSIGDELNFDANPYYGQPSQGEKPRSRILVEQLSSTDTDRASAHVPIDSVKPISGSYFSTRNLAMGKTVSDFFTYGQEGRRSGLKGVTQREQEIINNKKLTELFLSLAPFYDGVMNAIKGNVAGAIFDLGFDALGFLIPGAKGFATALKSGRGALKAISSGFVKGLSSSLGVDDVFKAPKNIGDGLSEAGRLGGNLLSKVQSGLSIGIKNHDAQKLYKHKDVVSDFYYKRLGRSEKMGPVTAIFLHGAWYIYNLVTKTPYGIQLTQYGVVQAVA